ncbi:unnamed protein product [Diatraea saccharalis]|uniref:Uncharacterized protein n=1 Tax=Diatraea saccharalis TaxID=40085 RepID=A0A9N9R9Q5_9NEOP|nr:unnamed protein product [Diatraea saccharalis]
MKSSHGGNDRTPEGLTLIVIVCCLECPWDDPQERTEALSGRLSKSASELSCVTKAPTSPPPRARSAHHHAPLSVVHRTQHFFTNLKVSYLYKMIPVFIKLRCRPNLSPKYCIFSRKLGIILQKNFIV